MENANYDAFEKFLLSNDLVGPGALERAKRGMHDAGSCLGVTLNRLGMLSEVDLVGAATSVLNIDAVERAEFPSKKIQLDEIQDSFLVASKALPINVTENQIRVAVVDPFNPFVKRALEYICEKNVEYVTSAPSDIDITLEEFYGDQEAVETDSADEYEVSGDDVDRLKDLASEAPVIRYVNRLLHDAVTRSASDIHIEPMEDGVKIRLRLDGMLEAVASPLDQHKSAITSRIKIMAGLDIAERRLPQDGRVRFAVQGRDIDFRVSTTPTAFGESVVLRILDRHQVKLDLENLGFPKKVQLGFKNALTHTNGIVLVTGPTGSGKTTTLYAALDILNKTSSKILTIEDPIEYMMNGVNQVQVNSRIGLDFASALRSFLRQDPDIMMVGEIRDSETAQVAIQAALTGHLILSTLHTNCAADALARLLDMGMEDFLLATTLRVVLAQRLVRTLCVNCRKQETLETSQHPTFTASGCDECMQTGYSGRTIIVEMLPISPSIRRLLREAASADDIEALAISEGMQTMESQGEQLVNAGITSHEEVYRVVGSAGVYEI